MKIITLNDLFDLLNFGACCLEKQNIHILKLRGARKVLFGLMVAVHNFTESIFSLCKENRTQACEALLRPLCDGLINVKFLYCAPRKHCHVIFLDALREKKKQLNHGLAFLKQNPQYAPEAKLDTKDILRSLKQVEQSEKATRKKMNQYPGNAISGTLERAKFVDSYNKAKNKKTYPLEWIYAIVLKMCNRVLSKLRSPVERVFGTLKRSYRYNRARYLSLRKNRLQLTITSMAYNIRRMEKLCA